MGRVARKIPARLGEKLFRIRTTFSLTQGELLEKLGCRGEVRDHAVSDYELGKSDPPLDVLLAYARLVHVPMEVLADDNLNLPDRLPASPKASPNNPRKPVKKNRT